MTALDEARPSLGAEYPDPLWIRAADTLRDQVLEGTLRQGSRLPPERELCAILRVSRVTLRKALVLLVDEGVLTRAQGRGWYVASRSQRDWPNSLESFTETANRMGLAATSEVLRAELAMSGIDDAEKLGIAAGTRVFHLERVRMLDGVPIALDRSMVPASLVPDAAAVDFRVRSLYEVLSEAGLDLSDAETTIEARPAEQFLAEKLSVRVGEPMLVMSQIVRSQAGRALLASTITYVGERYRLRTHFVRGPQRASGHLQ